MTVCFLNWNSNCSEEKGNIQEISGFLTTVTSQSVNFETSIEKCLMNIISDLVLFHSLGEAVTFFPEANVLSCI